MFSNNKMHFEISERRVLLLFFDAVFVLSALYILSLVFDYNYFVFDTSNFFSIVLLLSYVYIFGFVFEMYNLQVSSNQLQILQSVIFTATASSLAYLFTPFLSSFFALSCSVFFYIPATSYAI